MRYEEGIGFNAKRHTKRVKILSSWIVSLTLGSTMMALSPMTSLCQIVATIRSTDENCADIADSLLPAHFRQNTMLGLPKRGSGCDHIVISRKEFTLGYDSQLSATRWSSWNVTKEWLGKSGRTQDRFVADPQLPKSWKKLSHNTYNKSGFDRGHLCPSEQRTASKPTNKTTFYLTNVLPQRPDLNQGVWRDMERWIVANVQDSGKDVYVIAGGIFSGRKKLGRIIAVPDSCFMIAVVLNAGEGLDDVNTRSRVEAVIMPNKLGIRRHRWWRYKRSVDAIERATGYDFLSAVPEHIQAVLERD